jgi:hypothetical protein
VAPSLFTQQFSIWQRGEEKEGEGRGGEGREQCKQAEVEIADKRMRIKIEAKKWKVPVDTEGECLETVERHNARTDSPVP